MNTEFNPGYIVTGRIDEIKFDTVEVSLNCLVKNLKDHSQYKRDFAKVLQISENQILIEDLNNENFNTDPKSKNTGRFVPRRIAHEKFKNISSKRA